MIQGCGSDVGKSLLVAGLCRLLTNRGKIVRPFKPQNMSNNAAVTADGGEIGRSTALQALACRTPPTVDMNPVLLKPQSDTAAQLIVRGRRIETQHADTFARDRSDLLQVALDSFRGLQREADIVIVEGAGSPAETNLRAHDIANMGFAHAADVPVLLVGDIDRGHVIAALVGAHAVLDAPDRERIRGFIINKFRGDVQLFRAGIDAIEARTGWPSFGVVPWLHAAGALPAEDAMQLEHERPTRGECPRADRDPARAAHRELRRLRPVAVRARGAARIHRRGSASAARCGPHHPARQQGDDRRPRVLPRAGLAHRLAGARAPRRARPRHLRRLSDARQARRRPAADRRAARVVPRSRSARRSLDHDRAEDAALRIRRSSWQRARESRATKCISARRADPACPDR